MNSKHSTLCEGMEALAQSDGDIAKLFSPRHDAVLSLLARYAAEIELFNPAYGLVSTRDTRELIVRHILDSLSPLGIIKRLLESRKMRTPAAGNGEMRVADVGSGAGLPGIPLAIALPTVNFSLIERMGRRAGFLRNVQAALGLSNAAVEEADMQKAAPDRFSVVTFRAFRPLEPAVLKSLFRLCVEGGVLAAYKGRRAKIEEEMAALEHLTGGWEAIPCPVPLLDEERHLVVIRRPGP
jgi:16S rRNA (guanine527-N7)-methyltransferase